VWAPESGPLRASVGVSLLAARCDGVPRSVHAPSLVLELSVWPARAGARVLSGGRTPDVAEQGPT
jgi:hypothetical protein